MRAPLLGPSEGLKNKPLIVDRLVVVIADVVHQSPSEYYYSSV